MATTKKIRYAYEDLIEAIDTIIAKMDADEPITGNDFQRIDEVYQWLSRVREDAFDAWMDYLDSKIAEADRLLAEVRR